MMRRILPGLIILCLPALGGCSTKPPRLETLVILPPPALLEPCRETPVPTAGTNEDLLEFAVSLRLDLAACNERLAIARKWRKESEVMGKGK